MLTPILTVKTATPSAHVLAPEAVLPKEKVPVSAAALSGRQSEAALRILETINKQLLGTETPPKDALVRLLDTLTRLLKLPPVPQESLRALSKRIAAAIEALPPAARLALEKQLGQRNLLLSARILAEVVKPPLPEVFTRFDTPSQRLPNGQPASSRPLPEHAAGRPLEEMRQPQRPPEMPQRPAATILVGGNFDASALQAALRSAFNAEEDSTIGDTGAEDIEEIAAETAHEVEAEPAEHAAATATRHSSGEAIPTLRSMARFLADDAVALSKVEAIAVGVVDPDIREALEHALEADAPLELPFPDGEEVEQPPSPAAQPHMEKDELRPQLTKASLAETAETMLADSAAQDEAGGGSIDQPSFRAETPVTDRSARLIADALKVLIETALPLTAEELDTPAESLFALAAIEEIEAILDEQVAFRGTAFVPEKDGPADRAAQELMSEPDELETGSTPRETPRAAAPQAEERPREPLPQRPPESFFPREVPAFVAMPYPPVKNGSGGVTIEEEEPQSFGQGEEDQSEAEGQEAGDDARSQQSEDDEGGEEAEASADAYELYRRLGGIA